MLTSSFPQGYAILSAGPVAESFRTLAFNLVEKFNTGTFTFKRINEFYNTVSGQVEHALAASKSVKAVDDGIKSKVYGNITKGEVMVITSGIHMGDFHPTVNDIVTFPNGVDYRIVEEYHDAYYARFEMGVEKWRG